MPSPKKAVHYVFMAKPSHEFHANKSDCKYGTPKKDVQHIRVNSVGI